MLQHPQCNLINSATKHLIQIKILMQIKIQLPPDPIDETRKDLAGKLFLYRLYYI